MLVPLSGVAPASAAVGDAATLNGFVYEDSDLDGAFAGGDVPVVGADVSATCGWDHDDYLYTYVRDEFTVTGVTDASGNYSLAIKEGYDCRVEVTSIPAGLEFGYHVPGNASNVQFVYDAPAGITNARDVTVFDPTDHANLGVEIGNFIWSEGYEHDNPHEQSPGDVPLVGVTVSLYDASGSTLITSIVSDANGEWYFNSAGPDGVQGNGDDYFAPGDTVVLALDNPADYASGAALENHGFEAHGNFPAFFAVDGDWNTQTATGAWIHSYTTPAAGMNDYNIDGGFKVSGGWNDSALQKQFASASNGLPVAVGDLVTFNIVLHNQGPESDIAEYTVADYVQAGFSYDPADNPGGTVTDTSGDSFSYSWGGSAGDTAPEATISSVSGNEDFLSGEALTFPVVLEVAAGWDGSSDLLNYAEISTIDGGTNDVDSIPDSDPNNELGNIPTPGSIEDDEIGARPVPWIGNDHYVYTTGVDDEDDHDVAGVPAAMSSSFDLALQKFLNGASSTPTGVGDMVTFDIVITNQGSDVQTVDVTDYVQSGFAYDPADNGAGTVADSGDGEMFDYTWTGSAGDTSPIVEIRPDTGTETLADTETITVPIVLEVDATWDGSELVNWAEISNFDDNTDAADGDAVQAGTGIQLIDEDSTPDQIPGNDQAPFHFGTPGDDVITGDGDPPDPDAFSYVDNDEDDHDVAGIHNVAPIAPCAVMSADIVQDSLDGTPANFTTTLPSDAAAGDRLFVWILHDNTYDFDASGLPTGWNVAFEDSATTGLAGRAALIYYDWPIGDPTPPLTLPAAGNVDWVTFAVKNVDFSIPPQITSTGNRGPGIILPSITPVNDGALATTFFNTSIPAVGSANPLGETEADFAWSNPILETNEIIDSAFDRGKYQMNISYEDGLTGGQQYNPGAVGQDPWVQHFADFTRGFTMINECAPQDDIYDLALQKVLNTVDTSLPASPGDLVTFNIALTNQGDDVQTVDVTDYVQAGFNYDPADNSSGTVVDSGDGESFDYSWGGVAGDTSPVVEITPMNGTEVFATDETITVPIVLEIDPGFTGTELVNWAEISNFDDNTDPADGDGVQAGTGTQLSDQDSTPDQVQGNDVQPVDVGDPSDNEIDGDGDDTDADNDLVLDDEDDHDVAGVTVTQPDVTYSLGNQVWFDENNNGLIDSGEAFIPNVWVELFTDLDMDGLPDDTDMSGTIDVNDAIATTGTDINGLYLFDGLDAGKYVVGIPPMEFDAAQPLEGYVSSGPTSANPDDDVDNDDNGALGLDGYILSGDVMIGDGEPLLEDPDNDPATDDANENLTVDFGFYVPSTDTYSLGNQVWYDLDNNGMIDSGEALIPNVWVELFTDNDNDGFADDTNNDGVIDVNDAIATTGTDANGLYLFDGLDAGKYIVGIPPMEWDPGQPLEGYLSSDPTSTDANDDVDNNDDGTLGAGGYVWSTTVMIDNNEPLSEDPDNDPTTPDSNENLTVDFGFYLPSIEDVYSLGNQVWFDENNNGLIDSGEAPIPNVWVELFTDADLDGQPDDLNADGIIDVNDAIATTGTDANGLYLFDGLAAGKYVVGIPPMEWDPGQPLEGYLSSDPTSSDVNDDVDNNDDGAPGVDGYVLSTVVMLGDGEPLTEDPDNDPTTLDLNENLTVDFGFYIPEQTYSLGNQVWFDVNNNGLIDSGEAPIPNVWVELFTDADLDGQPDDLNSDGVIDVNDAIATTGTDANGLYLFDGLAAGKYVVGIPPMEWDPGQPLYGYLSSDPTSSDVNDDVDNNDDGAPGDYGYVWSTVVMIDNTEPLAEDPDNDPNTPDAHENLTVDFGFWQPRFDMALRKQLADGTNAATVTAGDVVTFNIEVFNQGNIAGFEPTIIDYTPSGLTLADSDWVLESDGSGTFQLTGVTILPGESVVVPVDFTVNADATGPIENLAEITQVTPVDVLGITIYMPNGQQLPDVDSVADANDDDAITDDVLDNTDGDEDDHDGAVLDLTQSLAFTANNTLHTIYAALALLLVGAVLAQTARRRMRQVLVVERFGGQL